MASTQITEPSTLFYGSIGAFQLGTWITLFLTGICVAQAFTYYQEFPNDRLLYKSLVTGLLVLDLAHSAVSAYTIWYWTVRYYAVTPLVHLVVCPWSFGIDPAMVGLAALCVQCFYAYRVYLLGNRRLVVPVLIATLSAVQFGWAVGATAMIFVLKEFSRFSEWTYGVNVWLITAAACDVLITGAMVYYLQRSKTAYEKTNSVLTTLIVHTIENNALTSAIAVVDAILFTVFPDDSWHATMNLLLVKLYFNSLLVSLNARKRLVRDLHGSRTVHSTMLRSDHKPGKWSFKNSSKSGSHPPEMGPSSVPHSPITIVMSSEQHPVEKMTEEEARRLTQYYELEKLEGREQPLPNPKGKAFESLRSQTSSSHSLKSQAASSSAVEEEQVEEHAK